MSNWDVCSAVSLFDENQNICKVDYLGRKAKRASKRPRFYHQAAFSLKFKRVSELTVLLYNWAGVIGPFDCLGILVILLSSLNLAQWMAYKYFFLSSVSGGNSILQC